MTDKPTYPPLFPPLIWAALALALSGGFGIGAYMVGGLAGWWPMGTWWLPVVQAHGHIQLFGWCGLFILAVGLFFLPRLRGEPLAFPFLIPWIATLLTVGIALRGVAQPALAVWQQGELHLLARLGLASSGLLTLMGVGLVVAALIGTLRRGPPLRERAGLWAVLPLLGVAFLSLLLAASLNAWQGVRVALAGTIVFPATPNALIIHLMLAGFILPVAVAFSVRTLPLFLRLPVPDVTLLRLITALFLAGVLLHLLGEVSGSPRLLSFGMVVEGGALLAAVLLLDVLTRIRLPWTVNRKFDPAPDRKPTRPGLPDYGEYGRFEWLIYTAYLWLTVGALLWLGGGLLGLAGRAALLPLDAARHAIAVGFVTLLIFGMAVRMLPGFVSRRQVASTRLIEATLWLGNTAALARVLPILLPSLPGVRLLLGLSGVLGWFAVAALAWNLWATLHAPTPVASSRRCRARASSASSS